MAQSLNSKQDYQAHMPKHVHNMTQSLAFTSSTGMELPIYYDMLHTGDEIHFSGNMFTRLNPLNVASLAEIDIHLHYFYVPLTLLYTPTWSLFYQTDDLVSSVFTSQYSSSNTLDKTNFPLFDIDTTLFDVKSGDGLDSSQKTPTNVIYYSSVYDSFHKAAARLMDLFGYNMYGLFDNLSTSPVKVNPLFTPWFLAAYQACHQFYFRNTDYEARDYSYQLDSYFSTSYSNGFTSPYLLKLNYVSAYKDYFNSVKVSPIGSSMSMLNGLDSFSLLSRVNSYLSNGQYSLSNDSNGSPSSSFNATSVFSQLGSSPRLQAAQIRQLYMVDKMLRVTGRANADYESQFLAHYGIKIPHDELHNITHIGHDKVTLSPAAVVSTADTFNGESGSALGEIGGQGYVSLSGKKRTFKAPFHGVFLCIYYSVPRMRYVGGFDKLNQLNNPMDFWQPEYDRKGMQPLFYFEIDRQNTNIFSSSILQNRLGWQYGYEQFKRKYDKVSYAFNNPSFTDSSTVNTYSPWVLSSRPFATPSGMWKSTGTTSNSPLVNFTSLLCSPHDLDTIMQVKYQSTWVSGLTQANVHLLWQTDPFIHDFRMDCKKVNMMSTYSEPEID